MISGLRRFLYRSAVLRPVDLPAFVLSVGNISMGGTGKSPFVMLLSQWAVDAGISVALLSRGYGRSSRELVLVSPHGAVPGPEATGDEPWMIRSRVPGISLLVHSRRAHMALRHWPELGSPRLVLMDDAFQHWRAARDRDVVMVDATESLSQGTLPLGRLRESPEALARADLVVITRAGVLAPGELASLEARIRHLASEPAKAPWKRSSSSRLRIVAADYEFSHFLDGEGNVLKEAPKERSFVLASGVAKPEGFRRLVQSLGLSVKEEIFFPDHHPLGAADRERIRASLKSQGDAALLITEKDLARWKEPLQGLKVFGLAVKFRFFGEGEALVREFFQEVVACSTRA